MRIRTILLASLLVAGAAQAQAQTLSPLTGSVGTPARPDVQAPAASAPAAPAPATPAAPHRGRRTLAQRFDAANTTHDGHLTLAQARAGHMNAVARDFAAIDKNRRGYVTMDDIREHAKAQRAARRSATPAQPPS